MTIHFICRGNAFRSLIAEAYLRSLGIKNLEVTSSGTVAKQYQISNEGNYQKTLALLQKHGIKKFAKSHYADQLQQGFLDSSDITICLNQIVYSECKDQSFKLPAKTYVWEVADLGEQGRVPTTEQERELYAEDVFKEITENVDKLVSAANLDQ